MTTALQDMTNTELLHRHANARATYDECLGHQKAERNRAAMDAMRRELDRRILIPLPYVAGVFNGPGSV